VWPWGNRNSVELRQRYEQRSDLSRVAPGVFQTSRDGSKVFFVERHGDDGATGRNVFILTQGGDKESVTTARSGQLLNQGDDKVLVLEHGQRNDVNAKTAEKTMASFERYSVLAWEKAVKRADDRPPKARTTLELLREPVLKNQAELSWRFGLLLGAGNLLLLGVGLSATNPRRPNNWNLLFALLGFVIYYNLVNLSQAWVGSGRLGLGVAMFGLHGSAFVLALALIFWRDRAATSRKPRAAKGAAPA
jgi:lipopolysaccharide export system permease protein